MKKLIICISGGIISALSLIQAYNFLLHPELKYYKRALSISSQYETQLRQELQRPCYVIAGGSETRSGIRPSLMLEEYGTPAINVATAAPYGLHVNLAIALNHIHPGDTLVLSLLSVDERNINATEGGTKLAVHQYGVNAFLKGGLPFDSRSVWALVSSDAASMITSAARKLTRGYAFTYDKHATLHPDGWQEIHRNTMHSAKLGKIKPSDYLIGPELSAMLKETQLYCQKQNAHFCIMLPVGFLNEYETERRIMHALQITRLGIPVLRDERLGHVTDNKLFSDMIFHPNKEGATQNTRIIASLLKEKRYWQEAELLELMQSHGYSEDATPQP